jgi:hypothetical protein
MFSKYLLIFLGLIVYSGCTNDNKTMADVVVMNAEIWTGNDDGGRRGESI